MTTPFRRLAMRLDRYCARLNSGLAAVAIVLAGLLVIIALNHLQQYRDPASDTLYAGMVGNE